MIDTLVLRIHNLSKYPYLYEKFIRDSPQTITKAVVNNSAVPHLENAQSFALVFHNSGSVLPVTQRSSYNIASSNYSVSYYVNAAADWIEFNLSLPKYLYSTNVLQFISRYDQSQHKTFEMLISFIKDFIRKELDNVPVLEDVEIHRVDLCYNQFFVTKEDALAYLDEQKKLLVKYARSSRNNYRSYDTSLVYITRRYSFKIYHKGTEFEKNDMKELMKKNPLKLDIPTLKKTADTILRYEMTIRNTYINYIFGQMIGASSNKINFNRMHKVYKCILLMVKAGYSREIEGYTTKAKQFYVSTPFDWHHNPFTVDPKITFATFDYEIFNNLYQEFWNRVNMYQITPVPTAQAIKNQIEDYNQQLKDYAKKMKSYGQDVKEQKKYASSLVLFAYLSQLVPIETVKKLLPRRTVFGLTTKAKEMGITIGNGVINIPIPRTDWFNYFNELGYLHRDDYF